MNCLRDLKAPISVNWEITPVCNQRCEFCFTESCLRLRHPPLEMELSILSALATAEVFGVRLFGGEPFCYPYWRQVVERADDLDFSLSFISNGTLLTEASVAFMRRHRIGHGAISIHGPKEVHNAIAGVDAFDRAMRGLRACLDAGMEISVLLTTTHANKHLIRSFGGFLSEQGFSPDQFAFAAGRLAPYGRARENWEENALSLQDYIQVMRDLDWLNGEYPYSFSFGDAIPLCLVPEELRYLVQGCWVGTGFGHIGWQGNVRGCSIAGGSFGNLLETPLTEIWTGQEMCEFRRMEWLPEKCRTCKQFCGGGCFASRFGGGRYTPDTFLEVDR